MRKREPVKKLLDTKRKPKPRRVPKVAGELAQFAEAVIVGCDSQEARILMEQVAKACGYKKVRHVKQSAAGPLVDAEPTEEDFEGGDEDSDTNRTP